MATLNEIAYNIRNMMYPNSLNLEGEISLEQIKHWIHYHRAKLIADNIKKGIINNRVLYQSYSLNAFNYANTYLQRYRQDWKNYLDRGGASQSVVSVPDPTSTSNYGSSGAHLISNFPRRTGHDLSGGWIALSSLTYDPTGNTQAYRDSRNRDQYGRSVNHSQLRGDYRNIGYAQFSVPTPLHVLDVQIKRKVFYPDNLDDYGETEVVDGVVTSTEENEADVGYSNNHISIPEMKGSDAMFANFNKFTDKNKPYYSFYTPNRKGEYNHSFSYDTLPTYIHDRTVSATYGSYRSNFHRIRVSGLQVSPNYFNNVDYTTSPIKILWKYDGYIKAIFENPTTVDIPRFNFEDYGNAWDDNTTPYPIPAENIKDLIDRVVQTETNVSLKTMASE